NRHRDCAPLERIELIRRGRRVLDNRYARQPWIEFLKKLKPFARQGGLVKKRSRHVSAGPGEAFREARGNWIAFEINRHEWRGPRDPLGDLHHVGSDDDDGTNVQIDKFDGEAVQTVPSSVGITFVN